MPADTSFLAAFLLDSSAVTTAGMCGGIVATLGFGLPAEVRGRWRSLLPWQLAYNGGRIISYVIAGALFGGIGGLVMHWIAIHQAQRLPLIATGVMMIVIGLYLGGWWFGLLRLESAGGNMWRCIEPVGRRPLPVRSILQALVLGIVWGWLRAGWSTACSYGPSPAAVPGRVPGYCWDSVWARCPTVGDRTVRESIGTLDATTVARHVAGALLMVFGVINLLRGWPH